MIQRRGGVRWKQADPFLLLSAIALTAFGVVLVTSATWQYSDRPSLATNPWFIKQSVFAGVGVIALLLGTVTHPRVLRAFASLIYVASMVALAAVLVVGHGSAEYGAQRWVEVAGFPLQPSEPAKVALVIVLARVFSSNGPRLRLFLVSAALTLVPVVLIYAQPDLGTALSMGAIWFGMLLLSGLPTRYMLGVAGLALVAAPIAWMGLQDYMRERVLIFLDPRADALGQGYNILQAQISIGSGGMWGKGLFEGSQTQLRYLRVSHSDFIFSVLGEELGFLGAMVMFALFLFLLVRILRAYENADEPFSSLLCAGVVSMIAFQAVANLGANMGLTPVTGVPLPLVSYGGTALVSQLGALGLVQATLVRRKLYRFEV